MSATNRLHSQLVQCGGMWQATIRNSQGRVVDAADFLNSEPAVRWLRARTGYGDHGGLHEYATGAWLRPATQEEREASDKEVAAGHPEGLIEVDGRTCYVQD